ncbi:MAG: hypothetical protein ACR2GN_08040 [Bacteroidia bacterium]|jgi:hypothetical protein
MGVQIADLIVLVAIGLIVFVIRYFDLVEINPAHIFLSVVVGYLAGKAVSFYDKPEKRKE